jgi:hypothetical protein
MILMHNRTDGWKDNNKKSLTGVDACLDGKVGDLICLRRFADLKDTSRI